MKKEDEKRLRELRKHLLLASVIANELSNKVKDFTESKPLNILYKEINALDYTTRVMLGETKVDKGEKFDFLWRIPDCLKIFMSLKGEEGCKI